MGNNRKKTMAKIPTILAIDDNETQLDIFKKILGPKYEICTADSASSAMHFLNKEKADLILLDIAMPNISGLDFLYDIRKIPSYMNVPIIIVSGIPGQDFLNKAKESSAFDVLFKPVKQETLIKTIEAAFAGTV